MTTSGRSMSCSACSRWVRGSPAEYSQRLGPPRRPRQWPFGPCLPEWAPPLTVRPWTAAGGPPRAQGGGSERQRARPACPPRGGAAGRQAKPSDARGGNGKAPAVVEEVKEVEEDDRLRPHIP